jgi:glycosyltransferase involved in cell wall biosynthesis
LPELTISMPARNAARHVHAALESVLAEQSVEMEVIVVDDASTDDTAARVIALGDSRVRLLGTAERRGIGWCHNLALRNSTAPFVAHVDADDLVVPGALATMVAALRAAPRAGQAYCDFIVTGPDGRVTEELADEWRCFFEHARRPPIDHRRQLLTYGMTVNHLRTYRREALDDIGGFDEQLPWAVDYEAALRLAERWEFLHVAAPLYIKRVLAEGASESVRFKSARFWAMRWRLARRALRRNGGRLMGLSSAHVHALLLAGLVDSAGIPRFVRRLVR